MHVPFPHARARTHAIGEKGVAFLRRPLTRAIYNELCSPNLSGPAGRTLRRPGA
jgi:hypothetical protein